MKKKIAILALGTMACFFTAQGAGAAMVAGPSATAVIDWTTFEVLLIDVTGAGAPVVTTTGQYDYSSVWAGSSYNSDYADDWSGTMAEASGSYARAMTGTDEISSFASLDFMEPDSASSGTYRYADFLVSGTGVLVVQADYSWQVQLSGAAGYNESASASVYMQLYDNYYGNVSTTSDYGSVYDYYYYSRDKLFDAGSGTLGAALYVTDGMRVHLYASTDASVYGHPVPVPAALWLFGSGFAGLLGMRWRRRA